MLLRSTRLTAIATAVKKLFSPGDLFSNGEQGAWYDPSDLTLGNMYQDSTKTLAVTAVEQPVGWIQDKSGRGNHAFQTVTTKRPTLSARVNLIRNSTTPWTQISSGTANITLTNTGAYGPDGATLSYKSVLSASGSVSYCYSNADTPSLPPNTLVKVSQRVKTTSNDYQYVLLKCLVASSRYAVLFNAATGDFVAQYTSGSPSDTTYSKENIGDGWWQFNIQFSSGASGIPEWGCLPSPVSNPTLDVALDITNRGDGVKGIYLAGTDIRVANNGVNLPAYQRVNTATDYATVGFPKYLKFDGIDDFLQMPDNSLSILQGQNQPFTVWAGVRKLTSANVQIFCAAGNSDPTAANNDFISSDVVSSQLRTAMRDYVAGVGITDKFAVSASMTFPYTFVATNNRTSTTGAAAINGISDTAVDLTLPALSLPLYTIGARRRGSSPTSDLYFDGRLYSLIVRGAQSTADEISKTEAYVNNLTKAYA
jgi:hypothetical protein